ncbi:MAG: hypothetical protein N3A54_00490 [Patescibacteria group bacterium]|nr:hypothetical protein [Patescibacteria group bacterium]
MNLAYTFEYNEDDLQQLSVLFPKFDKLYKKFNFEGLVIYYEEDKDWKTVKIVDPKYTEDIKKKIENDKKIQMTNFDILKDVFTKESLQKIIINIETSFGEKDITNDIKWKIIEIIFNYYSTKHEKVIKMLELEPKFFDVSINLVSPQIEEKIKNNVYYREFFSLIFRMFTNKNYSNYLKRIGFSTEVIDKISYIVERYDLASIEPYIEEPEKKKKTTRKQKVQKDKSPLKGEEPEGFEFDVEEKEEPVSLFIGRFQPPHIGHLNAINKFASYTPVICIVDTGRRTERSPFDSDDIEVIFRHFIKDGLLPKDTKIIKHYNGNIPEIINKYNLNVKEVLAGDDRIEGYKNQFPDDADINFVKTIRYFKGTDIRNWLNKGEIEKLKKAVPEGYLDMYFELFGGINTKEIEKGKKKEPILVGR